MENKSTESAKPLTQSEKLIGYLLLGALISLAVLPFYQVYKRYQIAKNGTETYGVYSGTHNSTEYVGNRPLTRTKVARRKATLTFHLPKRYVSKKIKVDSDVCDGDRETISYNTKDGRSYYIGRQETEWYGIMYLNKTRGWFMWGAGLLSLSFLLVLLWAKFSPNEEVNTSLRE